MFIINMNNYLLSLPNDIKREIYSFDNTYVNIFSKCMKDIDIYRNNMDIDDREMMSSIYIIGYNEWIFKNSYFKKRNLYKIYKPSNASRLCLLHKIYGYSIPLNKFLSFSKYTLNQIKKNKNKYMKYSNSIKESQTIPPWLGYNYCGEYTANYHR